MSSESILPNLPEMTLRDTKTKILITQTNIPLPAASTVIAASGKTGLQRTLRHSRATSGISEIPELGRPLHQNHSEATLSQPVSPPIVTSLGDVGTSLRPDMQYWLFMSCSSQ